MDDLDEIYLQFAETISNINEKEIELSNQKLLLDDLKKKLTSQESDGSYATEITAHAFKQIAERIELLARESGTINADVENQKLSKASNMKSFIFTSLALAHKNKQFIKKTSKSNGTEFQFSIKMNKWSDEKTLEFIAVTENSCVKTGYFNWAV